jgi:hypothetical protein
MAVLGAIITVGLLLATVGVLSPPRSASGAAAAAAAQAVPSADSSVPAVSPVPAVTSAGLGDYRPPTESEPPAEPAPPAAFEPPADTPSPVDPGKFGGARFSSPSTPTDFGPDGLPLARETVSAAGVARGGATDASSWGVSGTESRLASPSE